MGLVEDVVNSWQRNLVPGPRAALASLVDSCSRLVHIKGLEKRNTESLTACLVRFRIE